MLSGLDGEGACVVALMDCPECGKEISDRAPHCPHCGVPIAGPSVPPTPPPRAVPPIPPPRAVLPPADLYPSGKSAKPERKQIGCLGWALIIVGVVVAVGWVAMLTSGGGDSGGNSNRPSNVVTTQARSGTDDAGAKLACTHFRNVAADASAGILTDAELRQKIQEVNSSASASDIASVRNAAKAMLAAATSGTTAEFTSAVNAMSSAYKSVGF